MEGKGVTAEESPSPGIEQRNDAGAAGAADMVNSMTAPEGEVGASGGEPLPPGGAGSPQGGSEPGVPDVWQQSRVRVDARLLEATLLNLRKRIAAIPLVFDIPGADEVTAERAKLLSQIDDYLLPRVRQSAAPILVALVGSTGAGKNGLSDSTVGSSPRTPALRSLCVHSIGDPERNCRIISIASTKRAARSAAVWTSPGKGAKSCPDPALQPITKRPWESSASAAISRASFHGRRRPSGVTRAPNWTTSVDAAIAASVICASATGVPPAVSVSQVKNPSHPDASVH